MHICYNLFKAKLSISLKAHFNQKNKRKQPMKNNWTNTEEGIIHLSVTSNGTTGGEWVTYLEEFEGVRVSEYTRRRLSKMTPTSNKETRVAIIPHTLVGRNCDGHFTCSEITDFAKKRQMSYVDVEVSCLVRKYLDDATIQEMGFKWIACNQEGGSDYNLLYGNRHNHKVGRWMFDRWDNRDYYWCENAGTVYSMV